MRDSNPQAQRAAVFKTADLPISLILQRARYFKGIAVILQEIIDIVEAWNSKNYEFVHCLWKHLRIFCIVRENTLRYNYSDPDPSADGQDDISEMGWRIFVLPVKIHWGPITPILIRQLTDRMTYQMGWRIISL